MMNWIIMGCCVVVMSGSDTYEWGEGQQEQPQQAQQQQQVMVVIDTVQVFKPPCVLIDPNIRFDCEPEKKNNE